MPQAKPAGREGLGPRACAMFTAASDGIVLAAAQFDDLRLVDRAARWLIESEVDPRQFEVEITEGSAMRSPERTVERLMELRAIGVRVAPDGFGTGYSSPGYPRRFPVDTLKVDRTFLRNVPDDAGREDR